jgi:hypothetical protein
MAIACADVLACGVGTSGRNVGRFAVYRTPRHGACPGAGRRAEHGGNYNGSRSGSSLNVRLADVCYPRAPLRAVDFGPL